jgi:hypothetical protein
LFQGQAVPANKVHDFHPSITASGLYWVAPVPAKGLQIGPDTRSAVLEMKSLAVIDQPGWPQRNAPARPAIMSFKVTWEATDEKVELEDKDRHFSFQGYRARAQAEAAVEVPSLGFSWKSDPITTSEAKFAVIGTERNGKYFDER